MTNIIVLLPMPIDNSLPAMPFLVGLGIIALVIIIGVIILNIASHRL